jgi:hypothetical protein
MHACMHTHTYVLRSTYIHTCIHIHSYIHARMHTHIHTVFTEYFPNTCKVRHGSGNTWTADGKDRNAGPISNWHWVPEDTRIQLSVMERASVNIHLWNYKLWTRGALYSDPRFFKHFFLKSCFYKNGFETSCTTSVLDNIALFSLW